MKYYWIGILCCLVTLACSKHGLALREAEGEQASLLIRAREASDLIEKIACSFKSDPDKKDTSGERISYPDDCGGLYINKDKKVVVIALGDTSSYRKTLAQKIGRNDFLMQAGTYSYHTLKSILNELVSFYLDEQNRALVEEIGWAHFGLDVERNGIYIELKEYDPERVSLFKRKIKDSPVFIFEKSAGPVVMDTGSRDTLHIR